MPLFLRRTARPSRSGKSRNGSPPPRRIRSPWSTPPGQRAARQQLGAEAVLGSEHVERGHGGRELGGRGRDQGQIRIELGQYLAGLQIDQQIADRGAGRARRDHRGGGAPVGRGHRRRRHRGLGLALEVAEDLIDRAVRSARDDRRQAVRLAASGRGVERGDLVASLERNHVVGCGAPRAAGWRSAPRVPPTAPGAPRRAARRRRSRTRRAGAG